MAEPLLNLACCVISQKDVTLSSASRLIVKAFSKGKSRGSFHELDGSTKSSFVSTCSHQDFTMSAHVALSAHVATRTSP